MNGLQIRLLDVLSRDDYYPAAPALEEVDQPLRCQ
jgi:hypothetical protein